MKLWFLLVLLVFFSAALYYAYTIERKISISKKLIAHTKAFDRLSTDYRRSLLVLGDSTAVGVGAVSPEESLPGRVAALLQATYVENHAVSGAQVKDLYQQLQTIKRTEYDVILIQIGANDIVSFHDVNAVGSELEAVLEQLPSASKVIVLTAGNVGGAPIFPFFMRPIYEKINLSYHHLFEQIVHRQQMIYVNLYQSPSLDPFVRDPKIYFAADDFHPSSAGYLLWFEKVKKVF